MRAYLGLGANLGEPAEQLRAALRALAALPGTTVLRQSPFYRSAPVGPPGQPDYCNAVCAIDTALTPLALLDALQAIEAQAGRQRSGPRWSARMLDLDILHIEGLQLDSPRLTVPHPQLSRRSWVLQPLADIASDLEIPGLGPLRAALQAIGNADLCAW